MKYDARACLFNMDTGCVELTLQDGRKISIDCTGVEDALDVTMAQRSELDYLVLILSILVYTFFSRMFDLMLSPALKHSIAVA